ncbi:MAG: phosphate signaling complex protein PhoU [Candidatus Hodarchaeota archaeon]
MLRKRYREALDKLKKDVVKMGRRTIRSVRDAVQALEEKDVKLSDEVLKNNAEIDEMELNLESRCMQLIALQQPVGDELRFIGTTLKIIGNFDRISDLAGNIARINKETIDKPHVKPLIDIPRMCKIAQGMIQCIITAYDKEVLGDCIAELSKKDDLVDGLFEQIYRELITMMIEDPKIISDATSLLLVARYLERIADNACAIGGRIVYMVTGKRVKIS